MLHFSRQDVTTDPFPHIIKKGIFDESVAKELCATFPDDRFFDDSNPERQERNMLSLRDRRFKDFIDANPAWNALTRYLNSDEFVGKLISIFADDIAALNGWVKPDRCFFSRARWSTAGRGYQRLVSKINRTLHIKDEIRLELAINRSRIGYESRAHTDARYKLANFLIYLNDLDDCGREGGELLLFRHRDKKAPADYERHPPLDRLEPVAEVVPAMNTAYFGLNCNNSYHGVRALTLRRGERRFLYGSLNVLNTKDAWH